jgi:hypothetical protein
MSESASSRSMHLKPGALLPVAGGALAAGVDMYEGTFATKKIARPPPRWPPGPGFLSVARGRAA